MTPTKETLNSAIVNCLKNIYDPEIPVNIYDLGLIYNKASSPSMWNSPSTRRGISTTSAKR